MKNGKLKEEDVAKISITAKRLKEVDLDVVYKKLMEKRKRMKVN